MNKIRWAICDDNEYFCYIYKTKLENIESLEFIGSCLDSASVTGFAKENKPDILLLDIQMETDTSGIDVIPALKEAVPEMKIIILTSYNDDNYIYSAFANGADNYLLKDVSETEQISSAIINTYLGKANIAPELAQVLSRKTQSVEENVKSLLYAFEIISRLSKSELQILKALYKGQSYKEISQNLFIADSTLRNHISRILKKFNCSSTKELMTDLQQLGIFNYLSNL